jgi:hypothetical protein
MSPEELTSYLSDLSAAADVVEALDGKGARWGRIGDLAGWRYELIPWGVRFIREGEGVEPAEVFVQAPVPGSGKRVVISAR